MSNFQVSKWIKFFKEAGIPSDPSTNYAIIFYDNRIQDDMLPDLTKEILRDMGISIMGDVIAILRHAKQVHAQAEREKAAQAFATDKDVMESEKPKSTAASRMVDHWMNNQKFSTGSRSPSQRGDSPSRTTTPTKKKLTIQASVHSDEPPAKIAAKSLSDRFGRPADATTMKRKTSVPSDAETLSVSIPRSAPVKTKKIISKPKKAAASAVVAKAKSVKRQSVFDRLGKEPSEATPASSKVQIGTALSGSSKKEIKSLKPLKSSVLPQEKDKTTGSVFSRLGGLSTSTTTVKASVQPITASKRQEPKISIKLGNEAFESVDYTSHSVLQPAKKKGTLVAKATKGTKPVKQVKPVKRSVGLVADAGDKSVFARLGGKV